MKGKVEKDKNIRLLIQKYKIKRLILKTILHTQALPFELKLNAQLKLNDLPRNSSIIRTTNRCVVSNRSRGVYQLLKISRIKMREYIAQGLLPGFRKSSW